ncbi:hypothetical protein KY285_030293 [Solanum tuberosum]|nr:hypothetical protein KY285_030293 [Solanum tuberosum]
MLVEAAVLLILKVLPLIHHDLAGDAWSFDSNYHQSSQSRKMSIGIVIDSVSKCRTQKVKQAEDKTHLAAIKTSSKDISVDDGTTMAQKTSSKGNFTNDRNMKELASTSAMRNQREPTKKQTSPWISTKTVHHEPTSEADTQVDKLSIAQGVVEMCNTSHRMEVGPAECSLRSFLTQTRTLQLDKSKQAKEDASIEIRGNMNSRFLWKTCLRKKSKEKLPN